MINNQETYNLTDSQQGKLLQENKFDKKLIIKIKRIILI